MNHLTCFPSFKATADNNRNTQGSTTKEYCVKNVSEISFYSCVTSFEDIQEKGFFYFFLFIYFFRMFPRKVSGNRRDKKVSR